LACGAEAGLTIRIEKGCSLRTGTGLWMTWPPLGWAPLPGSCSQALITPFGFVPVSVGAARALPLRLLFAAVVFDARLDRFLAISSLPFLSCRHEIYERRPDRP